MSADAATLAFYEANAPRYTLSFGRAPSRHLDVFLDLLQPGSHLLELGCGAGPDAARMVERGFSVDATDGTAAMVAKAEERHGIQARTMLFDDLAAEGAYDAVWANACLLHVPRADLPQVLKAIHRALRPSGWHYGSFKLGEGEGRDLLGRLHNFPDESWLQEVYSAAGFQIENAIRYKGEGADGTMRDWCALTVRKPGR